MAAVPLSNTPRPSVTGDVNSSATTGGLLPSQPVDRKQKRERRGLSRWWVLFVLSGIAVYFLPAIVARTSLRQQIPQLLFPRLSGQVELGETSLGWFSPVDIRSLTLTDRNGKTLATVDRLSSSSSLWGLITRPRNLGEFQLERAVVHLHVDEGHSNWDEPLQELAGDPANKANTPASWKLLLPATQVLISQSDDDLEQVIDSLDLKVAMGDGASSDLTIVVQFPQEAGQTEPSLSVTGQLTPGRSPAIQIAAREFDLARLQPLTHLVSPLGVVRGRLSGTLHVEATASDGTAWSIDSDLQGSNITAAGWPILAGDVLNLEDTVLRGKINRSADRLECDNLRLQTDFAKLTAQGIGRWPGSVSALSTADEALQAVGDDFQLSAVVDAAKVAQRLPNSLRLKEGVSITSGQIQVTLQTMKDDKGRALDGNARFAELAAIVDGQERRWSAPLDAQLLLRPSADGVQCDRLSLRSDFCTVLGQGTPNAARFRITADLDRLWQEIAPLVDWKGASLAGTARLDGTIQRHDAGTVSLHVDGQGDGLRYGPPGSPEWSESHLTLSFDASGQGPVSAPWSTITTGDVTVASGNDSGKFKLLSPVDWSRPAPILPMSLEIAGDWARWQQRLRPFWSEPSISVAGNGQLTATVNYSPALIEIVSASLKSQPLQVTLPDWQIADSSFETTMQGTWDAKSRRWTTSRTTAKGEWGTITWSEGRYAVDSAGGSVAGRLDVNVNAGRVSRWQRGDVRHHLLGQVSGTVDLKPNGDAMHGDVDLHMTNAVVAGLSSEPQPRWIAQWREPELAIQGTVRHSMNATAWDIAELQVRASGLSVATNGRLDPRADGTEVDLCGQITYDWDQINSRLDPSWAEKIKLSGRGERPFSVKGTMRPTADGGVSIADLTGEAQLAWEQAVVYGLPISANDLSARFAQGQGQLGPLDVSVAEGRIHLAPRFDFRQSALLSLPVGRVVDRVQLTPDVCQQLLKYALPVAADAAEMDGAFSLDVDENVWPLLNPQAGKARGSLSIHHARIVPGPLANRLIGTVEQVRALLERRAPANVNAARFVLEFPEQTVALAQTNGRVYHDRMTIRVDNIDLVTGGSVGFDETLQLTFLLPIQEKWVRGTPALAKLAGQSLRIPVTGTLSQPQIDPSVIGQLAQQAAGSTIEKAIDDTVKKQLDRFLPRRN